MSTPELHRCVHQEWVGLRVPIFSFRDFAGDAIVERVNPFFEARHFSIRHLAGGVGDGLRVPLGEL